ncbi:MAG: DUF4143 domain-containing protein, partial [Prevotella sp.]
GLLYKVSRCTKIALPLDIYNDFSAFKLYTTDVGLLGAMVQTTPVQVLVKNDIFTEYKGGMTEQFVLQQMKSKGVCPICYYQAENSRLELDFVIQVEDHILPIEVKAGYSIKANSLTTLLKAKPELKAIRYSMLPYKEQGQLTCLPLYTV